MGFVGAAKPPLQTFPLLILIKSYHPVFNKVSQSRIPSLARVGVRVFVPRFSLLPGVPSIPLTPLAPLSPLP